MTEEDKQVAKKRLGVLEAPGFKLTPAFDEPLPEDELRLWNGEDGEDSNSMVLPDGPAARGAVTS